MVFTAQVNRPDQKDQQHAPASRPAPIEHNNQGRPEVQTSREVPQHIERRQIQHREPPPEQAHTPTPQAFHQEREKPRVYAVPATVPVENNRLFHHQHHDNWRPRYNFYDNQYHFYPYVNIAATMELSADCVSVMFNGQTYYYDGGTFYQQDNQGQYYAVVPPIGIIVSAIPADARQIIVNNQVFYRYKGVCYAQVAGGFQVVEQVEEDTDNS